MNYNYFFVKVPILRNKHYGLSGLVLYRIKTVQSGGKQSSHLSEYWKILFLLGLTLIAFISLKYHKLSHAFNPETLRSDYDVTSP